MTDQFVTKLPRWDGGLWLFRVVRETPARFYVEPFGENPRWSSPAMGRRDKQYIDRDRAVLLKSAEQIEPLRKAWTERNTEKQVADDLCRKAKAEAEERFQAVIEAL